MQLKKHNADWQVDRPIVLRKYRDWLGIVEGDNRYILEPPSPVMDASEPIHLRRSKRGASAISPIKPKKNTKSRSDGDESTQTPAKRNKKRVRFSEPTPRAIGSVTTGLTPYIRNTTLDTPRTVSLPLPPTAEYQFTPFRQVLTARCQRSLRRNGLSEEMNEYEAERKEKARLERQVQEKDEELKILREELERTKRESTVPLQEKISSSQQHIDEVEAELEALRQSFNEVDCMPEDDGFMDAPNGDDMIVDWSHIRAGGFARPSSPGADTIRIYEDADAKPDDVPHPRQIQADVQLLGMALELEIAKKEKRRLFQDVRRHIDAPGTTLNFADSPARNQMTLSHDSLESLPSPPADFYQNLGKALRTTTLRAEQAEEALQALENEIKTLGFFGDSGSKSLATISKHFREARLELERTMPGETITGLGENAKLLPEMIAKLKAVIRQGRDREAELRSMREQHRSLKGNFDHAIMAAEKANIRSKELEESIDQTAEEMMHIRMRSQQLERDNTEKDKTLERLVTALEKYRSDVARLESLVSNMEQEAASTLAQHAQQLSDMDAKVSAETTGRRAAEESAIERLNKIQELETALAKAKDTANKVDQQLNKLRGDTHSTSDAHAQELGGLNSRISSLSTALASANAEVDKLKLTKKKLEQRVRAEVEQAQTAVEAMQVEVEKALIKASEKRKGYVRASKVRVANSEMEDDDQFLSDGPMTPASMVRFVDVEEGEAGEAHVPGSVDIVRGKRRSSLRGLGLSTRRKGRRSYDSGVGMETLSEDELVQAFEDSDGELVTPELSSEADYESVEA